tara:strand:- start:290 stop:457 length:168 start_codon:yes stop_codon:yes gene_type:complete
MNKLLTTITLICFSVAVNADIYICPSARITGVEAGNKPEIITEEILTIVVSTKSS